MGDFFEKIFLELDVGMHEPVLVHMGDPLAQRQYQGVAHVHENRFVRSDIKFENVLLEEVAHGRCSAKLSDFGLAYGDVVCLCVHLPIFSARRSRSDNSETSTEGYCYHG